MSTQMTLHCNVIGCDTVERLAPSACMIPPGWHQVEYIVTVPSERGDAIMAQIEPVAEAVAKASSEMAKQTDALLDAIAASASSLFPPSCKRVVGHMCPKHTLPAMDVPDDDIPVVGPVIG